MTSEQAAAWTTAVFTAIQAIVVAGALVVAAYEWVGHERQSETAQRDAVLKLYSDQPSGADEARTFVRNYVICKWIVAPEGSHKQVVGATAEDVTHCNPWINTSETDVLLKTAPLERILDRVYLCVEAGVCNTPLSRKLFCSDALWLQRRDHIIKYGRSDVHYPEFAKSCPAEPDSLEIVHGDNTPTPQTPSTSKPAD